MDTGVMVALARTFSPNYKLHDRTGIPTSVAVPNRTAATQIIKDMIAQETFLDFILLLVKTGDKGHMGRRFKIPYMREIINGVIALGYLYDSENDIFIENSLQRQTRNWGALRRGVEYTIAFLRIDIVGNSELVRRYSPEKIRSTYDSMREIVRSAVDRRDGRIWSWDGDGGLAAFFRGNKHQSVVLSGIEIIHELFLYNNTGNPLDEPLKMRIAAHSGPFEYSPEEEALRNSETISRVMEIEHELCAPNSLTASEVIKMMLDASVLSLLNEFRDSSRKRYYSYTLKVEEK